MRHASLYIEQQWVDGERTETIADKYTARPATTVALPAKGQVVAAVDAARRVQSTSSYERYLILLEASRLVGERAEEFVDAIVADTGFTVGDARREVQRAQQTLLLYAEEAKRIDGEVVPLHGAPGGSRRLAFTTRHPLGVICAITPFNSPLNTVAHKVGPALAGGNGVVLKPALTTPLTAVLLVRVLLDAGLPPGLVALVHGPGDTVGEWLLTDPVPAMYAFTGSTEVGEHIHRTVGLRRTQLELGSLSSTIVCADANLDVALDKVVDAGFRKAGQVCTSVQRVYLARPVVDRFVERLVGRLATRKVGDPTDPATFVGPLISPSAAERVLRWVDEAVHGGARAVHGASADGSVVQPTVLVNVDPAMRVMREEIFGPVVCVRPFDELDEAIAEANQTPYGLAAGIFTRDIDQALTAARQLRMGSVHINETSSSRVDLLPYSGVKRSGMGKEGSRYAIAEMTEKRLITLDGVN